MNLRFIYQFHNAWGKIICAVFGFLMAGPIGALFGIFIGNFFDRGLINHFNQPYWDIRAEQHTEAFACFLKATFLIMGYVAKSSGRVSEEAIAYAKQTMHQLHLTKAKMTLAKQYFQLGKDKQFDITKTLIDFKVASQQHPKLLDTFLNIQYQSVLQNGCDHLALQTLDKIFNLLGYKLAMPDEPFTAYRYSTHSSNTHEKTASPHTALAHAYATLNLPHHASKQAVKQAYRRLMSRHHPDKLLSQGKSAQDIKAATEMTQIIRKAYDAICEAKGW